LIKAKGKTEGKLVICRSKYNLRQSTGYMTKETRSRHFWTEVSYLGTKPAFIVIASFLFFLSLTFAWTALSGFQSTGNVLFFYAPNFCLDRPFGFSVHRGAQSCLRSPSRVFDLASSLFSFSLFFLAMIILLRGANCFWNHWQHTSTIHYSKVRCLTFCFFFQKENKRSFYFSSCFKYQNLNNGRKIAHESK